MCGGGQLASPAATSGGQLRPNRQTDIDTLAAALALIGRASSFIRSFVQSKFARLLVVVRRSITLRNESAGPKSACNSADNANDGRQAHGKANGSCIVVLLIFVVVASHRWPARSGIVGGRYFAMTSMHATQICFLIIVVFISHPGISCLCSGAAAAFEGFEGLFRK